MSYPRSIRLMFLSNPRCFCRILFSSLSLSPPICIIFDRINLLMLIGYFCFTICFKQGWFLYCLESWGFIFIQLAITLTQKKGKELTYVFSKLFLLSFSLSCSIWKTWKQKLQLSLFYLVGSFSLTIMNLSRHQNAPKSAQGLSQKSFEVLYLYPVLSLQQF